MDDPQSTDSEEPQAPLPITSSIHTIYRPIARSRKNTPVAATSLGTRGSHIPEAFSNLSTEDIEDEEDDDDGDHDFEQSQIPSTPSNAIPASSPKGSRINSQPNRYTRSNNLTTVRVTRRTRLASKLKEIFEIKDIEEVVAGKTPRLIRVLGTESLPTLRNSMLAIALCLLV
jgi:sterol 3beta-glucosyltransferase